MMTFQRSPVGGEPTEVVPVRRPRPWKLVGALVLTAIGVVCITSPGLIGRRGGFPTEASVQTFGVCSAVIGAMATAATLVGIRRQRRP